MPLLGYSPASYAAIPAFWATCLLPHMISLGVKMSGNAMSNVSPRHDEELLKRKLPADKIALIQRLEAAQTNGFENLPLFIGAVLLSAIAKVPEEATAADAKMVLIFRILHTIGYAVGSTEATSYIRSTAYFASIYYIIRMYGRCLN